MFFASAGPGGEMAEGRGPLWGGFPTPCLHRVFVVANMFLLLGNSFNFMYSFSGVHFFVLKIF